MEKLNFKININASPEKVWNTLLEDASYRKWAAVFSEGSRAVTDWQTGSKALFVAENGDGMVSKIAESRPYELMSIEHLGFIKDGVEDFDSDEVKKWAGAMENYRLKPVAEGTELTIEMDSTAEYAGYFSETWPKALEKVKEIAES